MTAQNTGYKDQTDFDNTYHALSFSKPPNQHTKPCALKQRLNFVLTQTFLCSPFYMCLTGLRYQGQLYLDKSRKILSSCNRQLVSACVRVVFHRHQIDAVLMKNQSSGKVVKTTNYCPINGKLRLAQVISDVNGLFLELHHHLHEYSQETA